MNKPVMENPRPEKVATVGEILAKLNAAPAVFVSEYRGMSVTALAALRGTLRDVGAEHKVYKNTLAKLAVRQAGLDALDDLLVGPTSLTFAGTDTVGAAKALNAVARTNPLLVLKGGSLGATRLSVDDVKALADLPSPRGAAGDVRRCAAGAAGEDRRPAPGAAAQLRLRPLRPHRPPRRRLSDVPTTPTPPHHTF